VTGQGSNKYFLIKYTYEETSFKKQNQHDSTTESIKGNINFNIIKILTNSRHNKYFSVTSIIHYIT
jgi:hypothetical protein